jgi:hypothetical protein
MSGGETPGASLNRAAPPGSAAKRGTGAIQGENNRRGETGERGRISKKDAARLQADFSRSVSSSFFSVGARQFVGVNGFTNPCVVL